ncbi:MAG: ABC transporter permease [Nitrospinota bacterium]|nr:MAG: ABC transporter permease [Nitrospinota bacterium]
MVTRVLPRSATDILFYAYFLLCFLFILLPVLVLMAFSFHSGAYPALPFRSFTLKWYVALFHDQEIVEALLRSVLVGVASGLSATLLGFLAAYSLTRSRFPWHQAIYTFLMLPVMIAYLIIGLGLLILFTLLGIPKSLFAVWLSHTVINLPISVAILYAQLGKQQANLERAAQDLGANTVQTMLYVTLPLILPAILASFFLTFTLSWDEFIIAFLVSGFDVTLPVQIWSMLRSGISPRLNAVGTLVFTISIGLALATELLLTRQRNG